MIKIKKIKPGFTLIEALISSAITISIMSLVVSFLIKFTSFSNRTINQNDLVSELRTTQERLMPEILPANVVRANFNRPSGSNYPSPSVTASDKVLIFEVPIPGCGTNTVILEYDPTECNTNQNPTLCNTSSGNIGKLKFSLIPSVSSPPAGCRTEIIQQSLNSFINSTDGTNSYSLFTYYKNTATTPSPTPDPNSETAVSPTTANISTEADKVSIVVINLWTKKYNNGSYVYVNNTTQYVLRNK